ncbi:hypothetical protein HK105_203721 [Polyrhizophydium stewartii]|uniref:Uncharacterized protein n=1 Tax=Polyrhizophydium stewartii TaxID=2732419 RepID=A0ABR4NAY2_9FUNG
MLSSSSPSLPSSPARASGVPQHQNSSAVSGLLHRASDIFHVNGAAAAESPSPARRVNRNKSTVFDFGGADAPEAASPRGAAAAAAARRDRPASDIFGAYVPSPHSASRRSSPPDAPQIQPRRADADALADRLARADLADADASPDRVPAAARHKLSHQRSSVFDDSAAAAPIRGSRRHFPTGQSSSDIFQAEVPSTISPGARRRHFSPQASPTPFEPSWSPKREYTKSTSFDNVFGGAMEQASAPQPAVSPRLSPRSRTSAAPPPMDRTGGLSSTDLHRGARGKGRPLQPGTGSQIWF